MLFAVVLPPDGSESGGAQALLDQIAPADEQVLDVARARAQPRDIARPARYGNRERDLGAVDALRIFIDTEVACGWLEADAAVAQVGLASAFLWWPRIGAMPASIILPTASAETFV